jgi:hypothetical protein
LKSRSAARLYPRTGGRAGRIRTRFRPALLVVCLTVAIVLTGCTANPQPGATSRIYPHGLVVELARLKTPSGLFARPESSSDADVSAYSTALFQEAGYPALPVHLGSIDFARTNEPSIDTPLWFTWAYARLAGGTPAAPVRLSAVKGVSFQIPTPSTDPGQEIGSLWAWADTVSRLTPAATPTSLIDAKTRLESIDPATLGSPYLLWRMDAALKLLNAPISKDLLKAIQNATLPSSQNSVNSVLDVWGYLNLAHQSWTHLPIPSGLSQKLRSLADTVDPGDDLVESALAGSLRLLGSDIPGLAGQLKDRRDHASGLLRTVPTVYGSVGTTFLVGQLIPQDFASIAGRSTSIALKDFLRKNPSAAPLDRLQAVAALRMNGDSSWHDYSSLVTTTMSQIASAPVTSAGLASIVAVIDALQVISPDVPKPTLEIFATDSPENEYLARLALANKDMFSNARQIGMSFPSVQNELLAAALHPREPTKTYLTGLQALLGAQTVTTTSAQQAAIGAQLVHLRGCAGNPDLYRESLARHSDCSLEATRAAIISSFAYAKKGS